MAFLTQHYIDTYFPHNFRHIGKNMQISDKAVFYNTKNISLGDNCRIDDFAILSAGEGGIYIGNYVHVACHATIIGQGKVTLEDYSGISSRVALYSSSDNYDGEYMTNPCLPKEVLNTKHGDILLGKHTVVGSGSTILPDVQLFACAVGAMSLVKSGTIWANAIIAGIPASFKKLRKNNIYELEKLVK